MRGLRVLVVDDDAEMRALLRLGLERRGMVVDEAASGAECLERLADAEPFHVVVSDMRMPSPSGLDVLATLRSTGLTTPFVLITAFSDADLSRRVSTFERAVLLDKPFELQELVAQIERLANGSAQRTAHG